MGQNMDSAGDVLVAGFHQLLAVLGRVLALKLHVFTHQGGPRLCSILQSFLHF
jgi:hypothetical protein